jgi:hypothetical protein
VFSVGFVGVIVGPEKKCVFTISCCRFVGVSSLSFLFVFTSFTPSFLYVFLTSNLFIYEDVTRRRRRP